MYTTDHLKTLVQDGLKWVKAQPDVVEAEVFASTQNLLFTRLNYTSHIPCHGVEEPKSIENAGVSVQAVFQKEGAHWIGFGHQSGDLSIDGVRRSFEKARLSAIEDPDFRGLPAPPDSMNEPVLAAPYHDPSLMTVEDKALVDLGWRALSGALETYQKAGVSQKVIVGGDVSLLQERMAIAGSTGIWVWDEAATASASITSMLEIEEAKGSGWVVGTELSDKGVVPEAAGRAAAESVLASRHGERISSGEYTVILSPQAVGDFLSHIILPSLSLAVMDAAGSTFQGKLGQIVADPRFTLYDHGALPGKAGSRRYTCEGLPTGKTLLIDHGRMVGFLTNDYYRKKILNSPEALEKLGASPDQFPEAFVPKNGFRSGESLGRNFMAKPSISPTNVIVESEETCSLDQLLAEVDHGVYIGRIWYTYPMNGLRAGDFTSTIVGDSFLVQKGRKGTPLKPNTVRIHENIHRILQNILAFGNNTRPVLLWGSPEVIYSPEIAVSQVRLQAIAG